MKNVDAMDKKLLLLSTQQEYRMGAHYHILQRGVIPNKISIYDLDKKNWEDVFNYITNNYEWEKENHILTERHLENGQVETHHILYLNDKITVYKSNNVATLLFDGNINQEALKDIREKFYELKVEKNDTQSIGIIVSRGGGLNVQTFEFTLPEQSLIDYLNPSTKDFYQSMCKQLDSKNGSGLYLLHGRPGTGKTTFIKEVLGETSNQALFISPFFTESLTSPDLISLLMNYPDSILVIEDAETVLMERKADNSSAVSNLLNLTDGFLADFLNLKIICTFNTDLNNIDEALLREGRMKGMHEFTKIKPERAQNIADVLGSDINPSSPMTLAEICADKNISHDFQPTNIGFDNFPIEKPFN